MIRRKLFIILYLAVFWEGALSKAQAQEEVDARVAQIKAAIIYNIAKFVEWPAVSFDRLKICIPEKDSLSTVLEEMVRGKEIKGRGIDVIRFDPEKIAQQQKSVCQILFIGKFLSEIKSSTLENLTKQGILTICSVEQLAWGKCAAQIFEENNRARIAIDKEYIEKAGLRISSELLDLAVLKPADK